MPGAFSLEQDFFRKHVSDIQAYGRLFEGDFIDIGIPEDYLRAQDLLKDLT